MKEKFKSKFELLKKNISPFYDKIKKDSLDAVSAQISFYIVISLIPFTVLILSLLEAIDINGISLLNSVLNLIPLSVRDFIIKLFPENTALFASVSISALACIWSSSAAMRALIKGLNRIFESKEKRGFIKLRLISVAYTLIFALMLVFCAVLLIFGNIIYESILVFTNLSRFDFIPFIIDFKSLFVFLLLIIFFTLSYFLIPFKVNLKIKYCFYGALVSAGGWVTFSFFFSLYVEYIGKFSSVYGSLSALVLFMFWLYFCIYIMLLGGELASALQKN